MKLHSRFRFFLDFQCVNINTVDTPFIHKVFLLVHVCVLEMGLCLTRLSGWGSFQKNKLQEMSFLWGHRDEREEQGRVKIIPESQNEIVTGKP